MIDGCHRPGAQNPGRGGRPDRPRLSSADWNSSTAPATSASTSRAYDAARPSAPLGVDPALAVTADAQIFARDEPTASDANAHLSLTTDVRRRVGDPVLRWRRWLAWANPRSIFP
jgi:hypothetical protein